MQRTSIWHKILPVWSTCCMTKEIWVVGNSTVWRVAGRGGGVRWGEWLRGWLILEKIYTCTMYILEMHIGKKKRILYNSPVQKKKKNHKRSVGWKKKKKTWWRCSLGWEHELYFPTVMIKRFCIYTCVPAKKDSQHKDLFLSNGFFFKLTTPVVTNLCQGPRNLWAEWAIATPIFPSSFVLHILW